MPQIKLLESHVAELIAAGEVVERPASIVKELLENAVDAGASAITVEIRDGGTTFIRVSDNGCGIEAEDVPTAFLRHATSKIRTESDLDRIGTLGFRGEALAAIASVCRVELATRTAGQDLGTRYIIEGGEEREVEAFGCPQGTSITVKDVFFNTPARMKFLKKNVTEGNSVESAVQKTALSHPEISFRFVRDGADKLHTPGNGNLKDTIYGIFGRKISDGMISVSGSSGPYKVEGFVSAPGNARPNRTMQHFFINGRFVKTQTGSVALEQGYKNVLMSGRFPYCFLFIQMPNELVDVNVHPAKIEVRFAAEKEVFHAIYGAVRNAVLGASDDMAALRGDKEETFVTNNNTPNKFSKGSGAGKNTALQSDFKPDKKKDFTGYSDVLRSNATPAETQNGYGVAVSEQVLPKQGNLSGLTTPPVASIPASRGVSLDIEVGDEEVPAEKPQAVNSLHTDAAENFVNVPANDASEQSVLNMPVESPAIKTAEGLVPPLRTGEKNYPRAIGEVFDTYILAADGERFFIIDKHAAHERIIFERIKRDFKDISRQMLLAPVSLNLSLEEMSAVHENEKLLRDAGFVVEEFGAGTVVVREIPAFLSADIDVADLVAEIASNLIFNRAEIKSAKIDWLFNSIACRSAIKGGDKSSIAELQKLIEDIYNFEIVKFCPHGRPIVSEYSRSDMEKLFHRQ